VAEWFREEPYAVVGHAAAEAHRLTLDSSGLIELQLARRKSAIAFQGVRYQFVRANAKSVSKDNRRVKVAKTLVSVASPGKLLVLLLSLESARHSDRPVRDTRLAIEVIDRGRGFGYWTDVDWVPLVRRHGNSASARRLGYLLERFAVSQGRTLLQLRGPSGVVPFSPLYPPEGPIDRRWRLILNDPLIRQ
jgi:hypothetical protein